MSLLAGLCTLMGPGCHADLEDETQATRVVEGMKNHMMHLGDQEPRRRPVLPASEVERVERRDGGLMAVRGKPARTSTVHPARVVLPEAAQQPFLLEDEGSGLSLEVALEGVGPAKAEVVDGYVIYPDVNADGADVVHRFTAEGTEDYVRFERAPAAPEVRYRLGLGNTVAGLRLVGDTLEVLDASGAPRLRMTPPYVVGADGRITPAGLSVEGCAVDTDPAAPWGRSVKAPGARQCQVRVAWNGSDVAYPAVLDPAWITTGSLSVARSELTATRLPDGRILAAGGQLPAYDTTGRSELYDPATGTWASTGWMFVSRRQHTATLLNSGKVLAVGGYSGGGGLNGSTELYDPATGTWTRTGDLYKARGAHSATLLTDGRVLILGGWTSYESLSVSEVYNPATGTWGSGPPIQAKRQNHAAHLLANGKVLVLGGTYQSSTSYNSITHTELYDLAGWSSTVIGYNQHPHDYPSSLSLTDGRLLLFGGHFTSSELFDPATMAWTLTGAMQGTHYRGTASMLADGRVLAAGGSASTAGSERTELYDPATGTWSPSALLSVRRQAHAAAVLTNGRVLVLGGVGSDNAPLASVELFEPDIIDTAPPTVSLTAPSAGATLQGTVTVSASASDNLGVARVEFYDGSTLLGTDPAAPYSISWNTLQASQGAHTLTARAYDSGGNTGTSTALTVTVDNDVIAPTIVITAPSEGSTLSSFAGVTVNATDSHGVTKVELYDGLRLIGTDTTVPYSFSWNTRTATNGGHTLTTKAYDAVGNVGTSAPVNVTVDNVLNMAAYDDTLKAPVCTTVSSHCDSNGLLDGRGSLGPEPHAPNTLQGSCADGNTGVYHRERSVDRLQIFTTTTGTFEPGMLVRIEATVWASASYATERLDLYYAANASSPSWTYITSVTPGGPGVQTLMANYTLPLGSQQAIRARFRDSGTAAACGTSATDDHDDLVFAVGPSTDGTPPEVSLTAPIPGAVVSGTTTVSASASDSRGVTRVEFYVGTTLLGTRTASPYAVSWNTTGYTNGGYTLKVLAYDMAGNVGSIESPVTVNNVAPSVYYDTTLGAPRCGGTAASCDSGTFLTGRAQLGPESNAPNTVDTCTDGSSGYYHSDESLDRLKVSTLDGTSLARGKTVRIDATVWGYSSYTSDYLDLYYAPDASAPAWVYIGTMQATASGSHVLSRTYTLPSGSARAVVRGVFRYGGSTGSCPGGSYTDVDDLVFNAP